MPAIKVNEFAIVVPCCNRDAHPEAGKLVLELLARRMDKKLGSVQVTSQEIGQMTCDQKTQAMMKLNKLLAQATGPDVRQGVFSLLQLRPE